MIYNIQALRTLAATIVIIDHYYDFLKIFEFERFGGQGVDLFFVISGFIMVNNTQKSHPVPLEFLINRIIRIVPAYWVATLIFYVIAVTFPRVFNSSDVGFIDLMKSLFFIPFVKSGQSLRPTLFLGWTLNYEMFFYVLFCLSLAVRRYRTGLVAVLGALSAFAVCGPLIGPARPVLHFYANAIVMEFGFGMMLGMAAPYCPIQAPKIAKIITMVMLLGAISGLFVMPVLNPFPATQFLFGSSRLLTQGLPAAAVVGCAVALERWGMCANSAILLSLGDASYIIYLIHPFLTIPTSIILAKCHFSIVLGAIIIIFEIGFIYIMSLSIYKYVERPFIVSLRSKMRYLSGQPKAV